jgi:hypothetical protein
MVSLASQCFNNEYLYPVTPIEESFVDELRSRLSASTAAEQRHRLLPELAVYGMYCPLGRLDNSPNFLETGGELEEIVERQIAEPLEEERLKAGLRIGDPSDFAGCWTTI